MRWYDECSGRPRAVGRRDDEDMKYMDGCAIGAATLIATVYSEMGGGGLPMCLSIGACAGLALDWVLRRAQRLIERRRGSE